MVESRGRTSVRYISEDATQERNHKSPCLVTGLLKYFVHTHTPFESIWQKRLSNSSNVKQKGSFELSSNKLESRWPQIQLFYFLPMHRYKSYKKDQINYRKNKLLYLLCTFGHGMNRL